MDYTKLKVKELKAILGEFYNDSRLYHATDIYCFLADQRNVKCVGCSEKADFVKKCQETEHLEL